MKHIFITISGSLNTVEVYTVNSQFAFIHLMRTQLNGSHSTLKVHAHLEALGCSDCLLWHKPSDGSVVHLEKLFKSQDLVTPWDMRSLRNINTLYVGDSERRAEHRGKHFIKSCRILGGYA